MATSVGPLQCTGQTGQTNVLEMVPEQPLPLSVVPSSVFFPIQLVTLDRIIVRQ
jgi:hypothetical protein